MTLRLLHISISLIRWVDYDYFRRLSSLTSRLLRVTLNIHAILHRQMIGLASNWYPDWGHSETCRNDGAEPVYMVDSPSYITLTKEECCAKVCSLLVFSPRKCHSWHRNSGLISLCQFSLTTLQHYYWKLNDCLNEASNVVTVMAPCTPRSTSPSSSNQSITKTGYYPDW